MFVSMYLSYRGLACLQSFKCAVCFSHDVAPPIASTELCKYHAAFSKDYNAQRRSMFAVSLLGHASSFSFERDLELGFSHAGIRLGRL